MQLEIENDLISLRDINDDVAEDIFNRDEFIRSFGKKAFQTDSCTRYSYSIETSSLNVKDLMISLYKLIQETTDESLLVGCYALLKAILSRKQEDTRLGKLSNILICLRDQTLWIGHEKDADNCITEENEERLGRAAMSMMPVLDFLDNLIDSHLTTGIAFENEDELSSWEREQTRLSELRDLINVSGSSTSTFKPMRNNNIKRSKRTATTTRDGRIFQREAKRLRDLLKNVGNDRPLTESPETHSLFSVLKPNGIIQGRVKEIRRTEAIIDIGENIDARLSAKEISWRHVPDSSKILHAQFAIGQQVEARIMQIDPQKQKVQLSTRRLEPNPYRKFEQGQTVQVTITALHEFGAFARIEDEDIEGLIPVSKIVHPPIRHPADELSAGETLTARVIRVDCKKEKLTLSLIGIPRKKPSQPTIPQSQPQPA